MEDKNVGSLNIKESELLSVALDIIPSRDYNSPLESSLCKTKAIILGCLLKERELLNMARYSDNVFYKTSLELFKENEILNGFGPGDSLIVRIGNDWIGPFFMILTYLNFNWVYIQTKDKFSFFLISKRLVVNGNSKSTN